MARVFEHFAIRGDSEFFQAEIDPDCFGEARFYRVILHFDFAQDRDVPAVAVLGDGGGQQPPFGRASCAEPHQPNLGKPDMAFFDSDRLVGEVEGISVMGFLFEPGKALALLDGAERAVEVASHSLKRTGGCFAEPIRLFLHVWQASRHIGIEVELLFGGVIVLIQTQQLVPKPTACAAEPL